MTKSKMPVFSAEDEEELRRILERNDNQSLRSTPALKNAPVTSSHAKEVSPPLPREKSMARWLADIEGLESSQRRRLVLQQRERLLQELRVLDDALASLSSKPTEPTQLGEEQIRGALHRFDDERIKKQAPRSSQLPGVKQPQHSSPVSLTKPSPKMVTIQPQIKPIMEANDDWRAAITAPAYYNRDFGGINSEKKSRTVSASLKNSDIADDIDLDFDYGISNIAVVLVYLFLRRFGNGHE